MRILFFFVDGVGLGNNDPKVNPLVSARMPCLRQLLGGALLVSGIEPLTTLRATLLALDACLGVEGLPQSATGQATLLSGVNVPATLGYHYGPKPNHSIKELLLKHNLFSRLMQRGKKTGFLNAYPPRYFSAITSGRRMYATLPLAAQRAGVPLGTVADLFAGQALSADFTGHGWRETLGYADTPLLTPEQAGKRLACLAEQYDFSLFEYWLSDYAGHRQDFDWAIELLETFDRVLGGLLARWNDETGLVLIASDHGNLEDLSTHRHTTNPVPGLIIGAPKLRQCFAAGLHSLADIAGAILRLSESF